MKSQERFNTLLKKYENDPEYVAEGLFLQINEHIVKALQDQGLSRSALAQELGVSGAYVTKLLNGNENLTIRQLARIAAALKSDVSISFAMRKSSGKAIRYASDAYRSQLKVATPKSSYHAKRKLYPMPGRNLK